MDVDARQPDGQARHLALGRALDAPVRDQAHVRRCAAHVERDRVLDTGQPRDERRTDRAAGGPRHERDRRMRSDLVDRRHAAGRAHHERLPQPRLTARPRERPEVPRGDRPEVRISGRSRCALVLPKLGGDLVRRDDECVRQPAPNLVGNQALVRRVAKREEQADGHRLGVELRQRVELQLAQHTVRADPLRDAHAALERHERRRMVGAQAIQLRAVLPAQVQQVLEPPGRDERGARPAPLEERVGRDRRPVREALELAGADRTRRRNHGFLLARRRRHLRGDEPARVEEDGVRERAAHVDAEEGQLR
jgi:hypothetical protein